MELKNNSLKKASFLDNILDELDLKPDQEDFNSDLPKPSFNKQKEINSFFDVLTFLTNNGLLTFRVWK